MKPSCLKYAVFVRCLIVESDLLRKIQIHQLILVYHKSDKMSRAFEAKFELFSQSWF